MSKKFATLSDMQKKDGDGSDSGNEDADPNKRQAFYVGGSEKSGQQVLGPNRPQPDELINNLFKSAQQHGAEVLDRNQQSVAGASNSSVFSGTGIRLGDPGSATGAAGTNSASAQPSPAKEQRRTAQVVIHMWRNGFVVDDGPLRPYEDQQSRDFLESIMQNRIPAELLAKHPGAFIELDMENHRNENYKPPKVAANPFQGAGRALGGPSPAVVNNAATVAQVSPEKPVSSVPSANIVPVENFDASKPATNIQIRLSDGSRLVAQFNHTHRISDIRNYIIQAHRPSAANQNFVLMTSFPKHELNDESKTLVDANLLNAVIVQHFKQK